VAGDFVTLAGHYLERQTFDTIAKPLYLSVLTSDLSENRCTLFDPMFRDGHLLLRANPVCPDVFFMSGKLFRHIIEG
jgi:hypothetical protein